MRFLSLVSLSLASTLFACGGGGSGTCDPNMVDSDRDNCGRCGNQCQSGDICSAGQCMPGTCDPGEEGDCYSGTSETLGVGSCQAGRRTCGDDGYWGNCSGEILPVGEICGNGIDDNCEGSVDEDTDLDGDGYTTCQGDCCDSVECTNPVAVNPGAFEAEGNGFDDDCDGLIDNSIQTCDNGIASNTSDAMDFARAIDLCKTTTEVERGWGVISARLTLPDGSGTPDSDSYAVRDGFGAGNAPRVGARIAVLSTGAAADPADDNPQFQDFEGYDTGTDSNFPTDFIDANGGTLPNAPGCPGPDGNIAFNPVMLELRVRVPTNARSFRLNTNFFSAEYPEYACTEFNDFFVVLLDSGYDQADPPNPADKNLAIYTAENEAVYPIGVNLAHGNTGLFRECVNGTSGCEGSVTGTITTCTGTGGITGTGFDFNANGSCNNNSLSGGATGWLTTAGNVVPGEIITLRIAIWDTSDGEFDSLALLDNFQWSVEATEAGTIIE